MKITKYYCALIFFIIMHTNEVLSGEFPHFYIPPTIIMVPRLDRPLLSSIDIQLIDTTTSHIFSSTGHSVPLFAPLSKNCTQPESTAGRFSLTGFNFLLTQNLIHNFFFEAIIPYLCLTTYHKKSHPLAQASNSDSLMCQWQKTAQGDICLGIGWSHSFINCRRADFIDLCIKSDVIFPTAPGSQPSIPFSIPLGYDKHTGFLVSLSSDIGYFDWLTLGFCTNGIFFLNHNQKHLAPLTWINLFIIADHCARGLSLTLAYAYTSQSKGSIPVATPPAISNVAYKGWHMHILHFCAEYDFSSFKSCIGKRISLTHQIPVKGKRAFLSDPWEITIGLDFDWH